MRIAFERYFKPGDRVAAAVSGGADSVAMLELLLDARADLGIVVSVAHYNHRLRGQASDDDARFVASLATARDLEYFTACASTQHESNVEAAARRDRYAFFTSLPVKYVSTAHTADDQAETVLARLLRGSGPGGISGVLPVRQDRIVRPLLDVRRADLRTWAASRKLQWREDATNNDPRFLRNRIRQELIPLLERDYNPAIVETLARTAEVARAEEADHRLETEELAGRLLQPAEGQSGGWKLPLAEFVQLSEGRQRRLIRTAIERAKADLHRIDFRHVEQVRLLALQNRGERRRLELPGVSIEVHGNWLTMSV